MNESNRVETTDSWSFGKLLKYVLLPKPKGSPKAGKKEITLRLILAVSFGAFATQSLWLGKSLPKCDKTETIGLVEKIINDMPEARAANTQYISLKNITEQGYNKDQEIRSCKATLVTTVGEDEIQYSVKWSNKKEGTFWVEARLSGQAVITEGPVVEQSASISDGDVESEPIFEPSAPTVEYVPLNVSDRGVGDVFTLWRPDVSKGESGGEALDYQSRAGVMNVMESVVSEPDLTGYIKVEKAYSFGNNYLVIVSTGENGNSCPATTYAFTFNARTESVTGNTQIDGCSETVESLAEGNKLTVKKDGKPSVFYNGEVIKVRG